MLFILFRPTKELWIRICKRMKPHWQRKWKCALRLHLELNISIQNASYIVILQLAIVSMVKERYLKHLLIYYYTSFV